MLIVHCLGGNAGAYGTIIRNWNPQASSMPHPHSPSPSAHYAPPLIRIPPIPPRPSAITPIPHHPYPILLTLNDFVIHLFHSRGKNINVRKEMSSTSAPITPQQ